MGNKYERKDKKKELPYHQTLDICWEKIVQCLKPILDHKNSDLGQNIKNKLRFPIVCIKIDFAWITFFVVFYGNLTIFLLKT